MKKIIFIAMALMITVFSACSAADEAIDATGASTSLHAQDFGEAVDADETLVITEKMFTEQINFIYLNPDLYFGREIEYEGMYSYAEMGDVSLHYIYRYGPGCCAYDSNVGFEIIWDGERPAENDWVRVKGTVGSVIHEGQNYVVVDATEIDVLDERGQETVT